MHVKPEGFPARKVLPDTGALLIPLEEAGREMWTVRHGPYKGRRGSMSELYDAGAMDIADFAWIILNWSDPRKKRAAYTLLTSELGQFQTAEAVMRFGPEVVGGSDYLEEQQYDSMALAVTYAIIGMVGAVGLLVILVWTVIQRILEGNPWPLVIAAALFWVAVLAPPIALYVRHKWNQEIARFRNYRKGREGEEWVIERVRAKLDNRWVVFRNLKLPDQKGDCDVVLVGPPGVYVLEVKAWGGNLRVNEGVWEEQVKGKWKPTESNPQAQATGAAVAISDWLKKHGIILYVDKAVVLTQPQSATEFATSKVPVWLHFQVDNRLSELNAAHQVLTDDIHMRIITLLKETRNSTVTPV